MLNKGLFLVMFSLGIIPSIINAGGDITPGMEPYIEVIEPVPVRNVATPIYLGVGFVTGRYTDDCCEDVTYGGVIRVGYEYNQFLGFEARLLKTFWGEGEPYGQELEHVGLFVKPMVSLGDNFNMYGLLGYGWTQTNTSGTLNSAIDEYGFSAGAGLEYDLSDKKSDYDRNIYYPEGFDGQADQEQGWGLFVDYQRLLIKSGMPDLDAVSAGVTYDF